MNAEKTANSMPSAVLVVKAHLEEMSPCQDVEVATVVAAFWPHYSLKVEIAHENSGIAALLEVSWSLSSEVATSCYISGAIKILTSGVQKVDFVIIQRLGNIFGWSVVNDGSVSADA